jgi:hypothetical protein
VNLRDALDTLRDGGAATATVEFDASGDVKSLAVSFRADAAEPVAPPVDVLDADEDLPELARDPVAEIQARNAAKQPG